MSCTDKNTDWANFECCGKQCANHKENMKKKKRALLLQKMRALLTLVVPVAVVITVASLIIQ